MIELQRDRTDHRLFTWVIIGLWFVFTAATLGYNGPFFDEATQITAGLRTLEGHGYTDQYLVWFGGSLAWPILAGLGYTIAGLTGTRIVSTILCTIAFVALVKAARNLFGDKAALWTAVAFALNAPFGALARLGVYDSLALPSIAISFWAITELSRRDHRLWLVVAAVAFTLGTIAKYPIGLMLLPLLGVLVVLRRKRAAMDIFLFGFISGAIALSYFLPAREQLAMAPGWQFANKPKFGVTTEMIAFAFLYMGAVPTLLALHGWSVAKGQRVLSTVLLLNVAIWPLFHLSSGNPVSTNKHVVFSFLFIYPLVGLSLNALWKTVTRRSVVRKIARRTVVTLVVALLAVTGLIQRNQFDLAWPDTRQAAAYLVEHVQPGDQLLVNESWQFVLYLYSSRRIQSPWDVFDAYRITNNESEIGLCEYDWFVDVQGSYKWPELITDQIKACGGFRQVYSATSTVIGLGADLAYVSYPVPIAIWQNTSEGP